MYTRIAVFVILCLINLSFGAPIEDDDSVQLLDSFQSRKEEAFEFKYELSDGQMREEKIKYDDLDKGIAIKGSYTIELADGVMQTIYYVSDTKGHRISIGVPFNDDGELEKRPPPTRKPQNHAEARKKNPVVLEEVKSYEDNRIDDKSSRVARVQGQRKLTKATKITTTTAAPKVDEDEKNAEPEEVTEAQPEVKEDDNNEESENEQEGS